MILVSIRVWTSQQKEPKTATPLAYPLRVARPPCRAYLWFHLPSPVFNGGGDTAQKWGLGWRERFGQGSRNLQLGALNQHQLHFVSMNWSSWRIWFVRECERTETVAATRCTETMDSLQHDHDVSKPEILMHEKTNHPWYWLRGQSRWLYTGDIDQLTVNNRNILFSGVDCWVTLGDRDRPAISMASKPDG